MAEVRGGRGRGGGGSGWGVRVNLKAEALAHVLVFCVFHASMCFWLCCLLCVIVRVVLSFSVFSFVCVCVCDIFAGVFSCAISVSSFLCIRCLRFLFCVLHVCVFVLERSCSIFSVFCVIGALVCGALPCLFFAFLVVLFPCWCFSISLIVRVVSFSCCRFRDVPFVRRAVRLSLQH